MKPLLNLDEPVQRRSGEPAEILKRNAKGPFPIIALTTVNDGRGQVPDGYTLRGSWTVGGDDVERPNDLINVPPTIRKVKLWVAVWGDNNVGVYMNREPTLSEGYKAIKEFNLEIEVP